MLAGSQWPHPLSMTHHGFTLNGMNAGHSPVSTFVPSVTGAGTGTGSVLAGLQTASQGAVYSSQTSVGERVDQAAHHSPMAGYLPRHCMALHANTDTHIHTHLHTHECTHTLTHTLTDTLPHTQTHTHTLGGSLLLSRHFLDIRGWVGSCCERQLVHSPAPPKAVPTHVQSKEGK